MRILILIVTAFAAVSFPIYLVVITLRVLLMLTLAPVVGMILGTILKVREWQYRRNQKAMVKEVKL